MNMPVLVACGGDSEEGEDTAASCPDGSQLTYEADIAPLMAAYCVTCHAKAVPASQRHGAPTDHNFDTQLGILEEAEHIDKQAGSDGTITNTAMPPRGYPVPSQAEREKLSEWIACTAPANAPHIH